MIIIFHKKLLKYSTKVPFYLFEDLIRKPKYFLNLIKKDLDLKNLNTNINQDIIIQKLYNSELDTNKDIFKFKGPSEEKERLKKRNN